MSNKKTVKNNQKRLLSRSKQKRQALGRGLKNLLEPSFVKDPMDSQAHGIQFLEDEKVEIKGARGKGLKKASFYKGESFNQGEEKKGSLTSSVRVKMVGIEQLKPNESQPRKVFDDKSLQELAQSIQEKGILQPILVRSSQREPFVSEIEKEEKKSSIVKIEMFEIIAGERRWRAAQKAGLYEVPVILKEASDQKSLELALVENIQRKNLNPLEEAKAYDHLLKRYSLTQEKLARYLGRDRVTMANLLRLLNLSVESKKALSSDEISLGIAKVLLGLKYEKDQNILLEHIIQKKLTVREVTEEVHWFLKKGFFKFQKSHKKAEKSKGEKDIFLNQLIENLQQALGTRVRIHHNRGKGKVILYFYSDEELNRITDHVLKTH